MTINVTIRFCHLQEITFLRYFTVSSQDWNVTQPNATHGRLKIDFSDLWHYFMIYFMVQFLYNVIWFWHNSHSPILSFAHIDILQINLTKNRNFIKPLTFLISQFLIYRHDSYTMWYSYDIKLFCSHMLSEWLSIKTWHLTLDIHKRAGHLFSNTKCFIFHTDMIYTASTTPVTIVMHNITFRPVKQWPLNYRHSQWPSFDIC